ncbi:MAG TPA: hypothetical protein VFV31_15925 [Chitinophagaceae bacterium]|nr:hypothetical protein [Chitinophagaceae bacterium]
MYEKRKQPLASRNKYYTRVLYNILYTLVILAISLCIGIAGYHYIGHANWIDALHNSSMILSGMGPVIEIQNTAGKLFSSFYALFSGIVFITNVAIVLAPAVHRLFHRLHLEE